MQRRVVITGLGVISPVGTGLDRFWSSLAGGVSGIRRVTRFDPEQLITKIAGEVQDFDYSKYIKKKELRHMDRFTQLMVTAAGMAIEDSNLDLESENKNRVGVIMGFGIGGIETLEAQAAILMNKGAGRISPHFVPMMIANIGAAQVAIAYGLCGPNVTSVSACASSSNALGDAFKMLQWGHADVIVSGGAEAPVTPLAMAGFCAMKAMSTNNETPEKASRPFDLHRDGFVSGEGSAVLVLETLEHALDRGARIYAEISGYGSSCDAFHIVAPDPKGRGAFTSMQTAINDAGISVTDVDYINAHATSTNHGDKAEVVAIKNLFGAHAKKLAVSSTKSMTGHLLGAAGGLEATVCVLAINNSLIPPTINYENPDPECADLDFVPNTAKQAEINIAMSNSFGFGGHNVSLIFKKYNA